LVASLRFNKSSTFRQMLHLNSFGVYGLKLVISNDQSAQLYEQELTIDQRSKFEATNQTAGFSTRDQFEPIAMQFDNSISDQCSNSRAYN